MTVHVRYITDPACPRSWSTEPSVRKLMVEFGEDLSWTYVMGGLARDYAAGYEDAEAGIGASSEGTPYLALVGHWLDVADEGRMPVDPRLWTGSPIRSTYPACMAVKAAAEQSADGGYRYLRALREGLLCFRRKLDTTELLVDEARRSGLDEERFRIDLASNAIVEAFGADLEEARTVTDEARSAGEVTAAAGAERLPLPSMLFTGEAGRRWVLGRQPYERYHEAARAAGAAARDAPPPSVLDALRRFGRMATVEVEAVCALPTPRAAAELWRLASEWAVQPVRALTAYLWQPA